MSFVYLYGRMHTQLGVASCCSLSITRSCGGASAGRRSIFDTRRCVLIYMVARTRRGVLRPVGLYQAHAVVVHLRLDAALSVYVFLLVDPRRFVFRLVIQWLSWSHAHAAMCRVLLLITHADGSIGLWVNCR